MDTTDVTRWQRVLRIEGLSDPENASVLRWGYVMALVAMVLRIIFWVYTRRYWEDALITCLHSENFVRGLGLTHFSPGESPLHGFTSPLSVLIPLLGDLIHVGFGVEFLKLLSIPAAALTVLYLLAIGIHPKVRLPGPLIVLVMGYAAVEHHQILFGMAGMETQLATLVLIMSVYYTIAWRPVWLGASLGLCMLARPDFAFWTLIVGIYGFFRAPRDLPKVVGVALALYLPWIVFTTLYYGSPLPNTIIAKSLGYPHWWEKVDTINLAVIKRQVWMGLAEHLHLLLGPTFGGHGAGIHIFFTNGPESPIANLMFGFAVLGGLAILIRRRWELWPPAAWVVVYSLYYVFLVPTIFTWYKVPFALMLLLVSVWGIAAVSSFLPWSRLRKGLLSVFALAYVGVFAAVLPLTFQTERQIQAYIENPVRKAAGLYLAEHMKPDEAVGCEPLGYISYYSRGNVYDWPGLASRKVVAWSRKHPDGNLEKMLKALRPEYLFIRDLEYLYWFEDTTWINEDYHVVAVFQVDPKVSDRIRWIDRNIDTSFRLFKKNRPDDARPYDRSLLPKGKERSD